MANKSMAALLNATFASVVVAATVSMGCVGTSGAPIVVTRGTVIQNVTVVNTRDGTLSAGQALVVEGGKIVRMGPTSSVVASASAQTVDGSGKYVVPGFADMHVHAMVHADERVSYFPLMLANGITSFREMGAFPGQYPDMVRRSRQLNADISAGVVDAPEVLLVPSDIYQSATSAASAARAVQQQKAAGVDFIKVISANRDAMLAFLSEAKSHGTYVAGHLTPAVSARESSDLGWRTIEHLGSGIGILLDCSTDEAEMRLSIVAAARGNAPAFPTDASSVRGVASTYSADKCRRLADDFVRNGTWHVPTLRRVRALDQTGDPFFQNDPNMIYVDSARRALWANLLRTFSSLPSETKAALHDLYALQQATTKLMKDAGVKMMAGSDAGVASVWVIPGIALHQEFRELAAAGLPPLQILQMATLNPAEFLGRQSTMGSVEVGKNADLILLDGNPVQDVANLDKISGLFLKGKYFSKDALAKLAGDTAAAYATAGMNAFPIAAVESAHTD